MRIQLSSLHFREKILQGGTKVYRAVKERDHTFQPDVSLISEGRFNRDHQYCFYIASHLKSAILEIISHYQNCIPSIIYVKELILQDDLTLVDLIRWHYNEPEDRRNYSSEHIMINQHITCPKRYWSDWLYGSTQTIADYFRNTYDGFIYQTAVAHLLSDEQRQIVYDRNPRKLLNYAIFKDPCECRRLFAVSNDIHVVKTVHYLDFYNKYIDDDASRHSIRCRNAQETIFAKYEDTGSLDIYVFISE